MVTTITIKPNLCTLLIDRQLALESQPQVTSEDN